MNPRASASTAASSALLVLLALSAGGTDLGAQEAGAGPRVLEAGVEARPDPSGAAIRIRIDYRLRPEGHDAIPLQAVEFFGFTIAEVEIGWGAAVPARPVELRRTASGSLMGAVQVPPSDASEVEITVAYTVRPPSDFDDTRFDMTLPLVMVDWPPEAAREELFTARVDLPAGYAVVEVFPMVPRGVDEAGGWRSHTLSLPVVPSMLRFRGRIGTAPVLTLERVVDLGVGAVLILLALVGWRALRRNEAGHRRAAASRAGDPA